MAINLVLMIFMIVAALWTVMSRSLLRCAIGLALTSAILSIVIFRMNSPLAAVFELSVCTGLISVLFISAISLTEPLTQEEKIRHMKERLARFRYLPVIVVLLAVILSWVKVKINLNLPAAQGLAGVQEVLWNSRQLDLIGQIIILMVGVFGVVILFKEAGKK